MARQRRVEDLSVDELRHLLIEKRRVGRQARLEAFKRTGRVIDVEPQPEAVPLQPAAAASDLIEEAPARSSRRTRRRSAADTLLFLVEIAAVIGLGFVLLSGLNVLSTLNQEVASALIQPTLTPTAIIQAAVLPSGHTPPDASGNSRFNEAEIPEHLRPLMQSIADLPLPTPSPQQAVRIQIPAIGVDWPVVQGDNWEQLKKGVAQHLGTPNPGQKGNIVLSGHNDVYGEVFRYLDKLKTGDQIILFTNIRTYTYIVRQTQIVEPIQVDVMDQTSDGSVTLISCYPYRVDKQRIVVQAILQDAP